jgi:hypothetical protein
LTNLVGHVSLFGSLVVCAAGLEGVMASYTMVSPGVFLIWFKIALRTNENLIGLKLSDV